jgi:signal transduction histidine kinase
MLPTLKLLLVEDDAPMQTALQRPLRLRGIDVQVCTDCALAALDLSPLIAAKDIDFSIETEPASIDSHEWMLAELTRNLLHNAIKHTPTGGALAVRIVRDSRYAAMRIADSGAGISGELATRLYQPFSAGRVGYGSGLGLAICSEIVNALGGTISLDNRAVQCRSSWFKMTPDG